MLHTFLLISILSSATLLIDESLSESIDQHDAVVEVARKTVTAEWQKAINDAIADNDLTLTGQYQTWSDHFIREEAMFLAPKHPGMINVYKEYGAVKKKAGDILRKAYIKEADRLIKAGMPDDARALQTELIERRLPGELVSLQLYRSKDYVFHYGFTLQRQTPTQPGHRLNCTWELTAGLSNSAFLSIRPVNFPKSFVCHHGWRIRIDPEQNDTAWKEHATWIREPGLADAKRGYSFRSASHPNRYIRVRANGELWLDPLERTPGYLQSATFSESRPLFPLWSSVAE